MGDRPTRVVERVSHSYSEQLTFIQDYIMVINIAAAVGTVAYVATRLCSNEAAQARRRRKRAKRDPERGETDPSQEPAQSIGALLSEEPIAGPSTAQNTSQSPSERNDCPSAQQPLQTQDSEPLPTLPQTLHIAQEHSEPSIISPATAQQAVQLPNVQVAVVSDPAPQQQPIAHPEDSTPATPIQSPAVEIAPQVTQASSVPSQIEASPAPPSAQIADVPLTSASEPQPSPESRPVENASSVAVSASQVQPGPGPQTGTAALDAQIQSSQSAGPSEQEVQPVTAPIPSSVALALAPAPSSPQQQSEIRPQNSRQRSRQLRQARRQAARVSPLAAIIEPASQSQPPSATTSTHSAGPSTRLPQATVTPSQPSSQTPSHSAAPQPSAPPSSPPRQPRSQPQPPPSRRHQRTQSTAAGPSRSNASSSTSNAQTQTPPPTDPEITKLLAQLEQSQEQAGVSQEFISALKGENKDLLEKQLRWKGFVETISRDLKKRDDEDLEKIKGWIVMTERLIKMTGGAKQAERLMKELKDHVQKIEEDKDDPLGIEAFVEMSKKETSKAVASEEKKKDGKNGGGKGKGHAKSMIAGCGSDGLAPAKKNEDDGFCVICLERKAAFAILECGHLCLCSTCSTSKKLRECPLCRKPIARVVKIWQ